MTAVVCIAAVALLIAWLHVTHRSDRNARRGVSQLRRRQLDTIAARDQLQATKEP